MAAPIPRRPAPPVLVTADRELADRVRELAAATGVTVAVVDTGAGAGRLWVESPLVLVGGDVPVAALPGRRDGLVVVARVASPSLWEQAGVLGAAHVLVLPGSEAMLADLLLCAPSGGAAPGRVVGVLGAVGGCGASTLAVALAANVATGDGRAGTAVLVDADPVSGGLHLALGTEHEPGLRWSDLDGVRGALRPDVLTQALPMLDGVRVLGWSNDETPSASEDADPVLDGLVPWDAMRSVVAAARSIVDLTVVDLPRRLDTRAAQQWRLLDTVVLVVPAQVRGVVTGRRVLDCLTAAVPNVHVVVRTVRRDGLAVGTVADALACPVSGPWAPDHRLAGAAERGDLLHSSRSGATGRLARALARQMAEHSDGLVPKVAG